jgi:hypothetical protein
MGKGDGLKKLLCVIRQFNSIEYIQSNLYLEVISVIKKEWFSKIDDLLKEVHRHRSWYFCAQNLRGLGLGYNVWCLTPLLTIFQLYRGCQFY